MTHGHDRQPLWLPLGFIALGILSRLVPHPWNVTPVMAIALFGGTVLSPRWAILLPLSIVAASDVLIGWHNTVPFTWGAFVLTGALAWWVRRSPGPKRVFAGSLAGSTLFFLLTNFGVWLNGDLYPRTAEGFWQCYAAAVPFFRNALAGNLIFTAVLFGGYALASRALPAREPVRP
jgi:signal transduction histidine kinase